MAFLSIYSLKLLFTIVFFIIASGINIKNILLNLFSFTTKLFQRKNLNSMSENSTENLTDIVKDSTLEETTQQSFLFSKESKIKNRSKSIFKLPSLELLEKNSSKISNCYEDMY